MKLVECVPNFSEGRDRGIIDAIAAAIRSVPGAMLLDVDPGAATKRTVVTFVGAPESVAEAAFQAARVAAERIDMRRHKGEHPRLGATDVCPFVPVAGVSLEECAELARRVGRRIGEELGIPVYLYEAAASRPERTNLADIRKGEYEGLPQKLADPDWQPDFGPAEFNARSGATVVGARRFLVAYNVNLNTTDKALANEVAFGIRESGRVTKDASGEVVRDAGGEPVRLPGRFRGVKAIGWYIPEYGRAQVSINLTDLSLSPLHAVFDACCEEAARVGLRVTGSEIVGMVPLSVILDAGRHFLQKQGRSRGVPEGWLVRAAVQSLGLSEVASFDPAQKIIEYRVRPGGRMLAGLPLAGFADEVSSSSPTPGGGSVAAACGALGAALAGMVANLTHAARGFEAEKDRMEAVAVEAQALKGAFLDDVDRDAKAFEAVLAALRMPKGTPDERAARERSLAEANRGATEVPLDVLMRVLRVLELAAQTAAHGLPTAASDAGAAAAASLAAAEAAYLNVRINLPNVVDAVWRESTRGTAERVIAEARQRAGSVIASVLARLPG